MPIRALNVRSSGKNEQHMLALSLTALDPKQTLGLNVCEGIVNAYSYVASR
jgi:hypothetical protein